MTTLERDNVKTYLRLREALTREQVEQVVEMILHTHGLAIERKCDQSLTLAFNEKGYLRRIDGSNNIRPVSPLSGVAPATQVAGVGDSGLKPPRPKVPPE